LINILKLYIILLPHTYTTLIQIVESLLIEKPANPIAFIIEYLKKQYPDQAKVAFEGSPAAAE
jgi:hypothetical protein